MEKLADLTQFKFETLLGSIFFSALYLGASCWVWNRFVPEVVRFGSSHLHWQFSIEPFLFICFFAWVGALIERLRYLLILFLICAILFFLPLGTGNVGPAWSIRPIISNLRLVSLLWLFLGQFVYLAYRLALLDRKRRNQGFNPPV